MPPVRLSGQFLRIDPDEDADTFYNPEVHNHPFLILSNRADPNGNVVALKVTSFKEKSLEKARQNPELRAEYLPIAPSDPHPESHQILHMHDESENLFKKSYVKISERFDIPAKYLVPYCWSKTNVEFKLSEESFRVVARASGFGLPVNDEVVAPTPSPTSVSQKQDKRTQQTPILLNTNSQGAGKANVVANKASGTSKRKGKTTSSNTVARDGKERTATPRAFLRSEGAEIESSVADMAEENPAGHIPAGLNGDDGKHHESRRAASCVTPVEGPDYQKDEITASTTLQDTDSGKEPVPAVTTHRSKAAKGGEVNQGQKAESGASQASLVTGASRLTVSFSETVPPAREDRPSRQVVADDNTVPHDEVSEERSIFQIILAFFAMLAVSIILTVLERNGL